MISLFACMAQGYLPAMSTGNRPKLHQCDLLDRDSDNESDLFDPVAAAADSSSASSSPPLSRG